MKLQQCTGVQNIWEKRAQVECGTLRVQAIFGSATKLEDEANFLEWHSTVSGSGADSSGKCTREAIGRRMWNTSLKKVNYVWHFLWFCGDDFKTAHITRGFKGKHWDSKIDTKIGPKSPAQDGNQNMCCGRELRASKCRCR